MIGRKVWRYWPNEGDNGWVKAIITDFKENTGEHVIAYDLNTSKQSYEYYNFRYVEGCLVLFGGWLRSSGGRVFDSALCGVLLRVGFLLYVGVLLHVGGGILSSMPFPPLKKGWPTQKNMRL